MIRVCPFTISKSPVLRAVREENYSQAWTQQPDHMMSFVDITSFAAYVGGCPTNISVGTRRLGLQSALFSAVGEDQVGNFILHFLRQEGVEIRFTPTKPGRRSSAVVLGIEPPTRFPLTYYREN